MLSVDKLKELNNIIGIMKIIIMIMIINVIVYGKFIM